MDFSKLLKNFRDLFPYLFFGVCTTLVNIAVYALCARLLGMPTVPSTIIAWIASVLFAYITNRKWVFHSSASGFSAITKEIVSFFACRLATGVIDWLCMFVFVDLLHFNDLVIKIAANILVIVLNYVASKLMIFKKKKTEPETSAPENPAAPKE